MEDLWHRLTKHRLTNVWLLDRLCEQGIKCYPSELSEMMMGTRDTPKARIVIEVSHKILDAYESVFGSTKGA